jgi:hypothetical protein
VILVLEPRYRVVGLGLEQAARASLPEWAASNIGKRPPCSRLCTSAVMNTVLPARDSPVTPSLSVGCTRLLARSVKRVEGDQGLVGEDW